MAAAAARAFVAESVGDHDHVTALVAELLGHATAGDAAEVARTVLGMWCAMAGQAGLVLDGPATVLAGDETDTPASQAMWWAAELVTAYTHGDLDRVDLMLSVWPAAGLGAAMLAVLNVAATVFLHAMQPHHPV